VENYNQNSKLDDSIIENLETLIYYLCAKCDHTNLLNYVVFSLFGEVEEPIIIDSYNEYTFNLDVMKTTLALCNEHNNADILKYLLLDVQKFEERIGTLLVSIAFYSLDINLVSNTLVDFLLDPYILSEKIIRIYDDAVQNLSELMKDDVEKSRCFHQSSNTHGEF
jgi:hypothetical protein